MKKLQKICAVLMAAPITVTVISLFFLPEKIPAHYDLQNNVTRYGSKFEALAMPAVTILMGIFMMYTASVIDKQEPNGSNNKKVCLVSAAIMLGIFNVLTYFFLCTAFKNVTSLSDISPDINSLMCAVMGIGLVIIGNIMPKLRINSMIGLRTSWSMKNDVTWKKSQLFCGISCIIGGIIITAISLFTNGLACTAASTAVIGAIAAAGVIFSYNIAKKY